MAKKMNKEELKATTDTAMVDSTATTDTATVDSTGANLKKKFRGSRWTKIHNPGEADFEITENILKNRRKSALIMTLGAVRSKKSTKAFTKLM